MNRSNVPAVVAVGLLLAVAACGSDDATEPVAGSEASEATQAADEPAAGGGDKAGNAPTSDAVTLSLALISSPERPRGALGARFVEEIEAQDGPVTVQVEYSTEDPIADFMDGTVDMVLTPTNTLDLLGVTTFRALSLPFLVDDDDQADRVAADPVVDTMLAGLDAIDATGLMFAPIAEQHLAVQGDEPLRELDQLAGGMRAVPESDVAAAMFEAFGATPKYGFDDDDWDAAVRSGDIVAKEFPTALYGVGPLPAAMAANLTISYDFEVLLIRNDVFDQLSTEAADALRAAAASAQQRQIDERLREDEVFRNECAKGADLTAAPIALWAAIGRETDDDVLAQLEDPDTREVYDAVKRAAGQRSLSWPNECRNGEVVPYEPPTTPGAEVPDGTYRVEGRSVEQLLVSGVGADTATVGNEVDYWELTLTDGIATLAFHQPDGTVVEERSSFAFDDDGYIVFTAEPGEDGLNGTNAWSLTDDGFRLEPVPTDDVGALNVMYDVAGLGLFEFTKVG